MSNDLGIHTDSPGKGDSPRNLSEKFRENYDLIDWHRPQPVPPTEVKPEEKSSV